MSDSARELELFVENEPMLYGMYTSVVDNLMKKRRSGVYDHELAARAFYNLVNRGAQMYFREHAAGQGRWFNMFPTSVRWEAARNLRDGFEAEAGSDNDDMLAEADAKAAEATRRSPRSTS